ncbi:hypothetical protein DRN94_003230 [archaeon]|nr:hypothetical protein [archaeon]
MAEGRPRLRGYVCTVCGKKVWAMRRPTICPACESVGVFRKTDDYRIACERKECKHNVGGQYCKLKSPGIEGDRCSDFEPRKP